MYHIPANHMRNQKNFKKDFKNNIFTKKKKMEQVDKHQLSKCIHCILQMEQVDQHQLSKCIHCILQMEQVDKNQLSKCIHCILQMEQVEQHQLSKCNLVQLTNGAS